MKPRHKTSLRLTVSAKALLDALTEQLHCPQAVVVERALQALERALHTPVPEAPQPQTTHIADARAWNRL